MNQYGPVFGFLCSSSLIVGLCVHSMTPARALAGPAVETIMLSEWDAPGTETGVRFFDLVPGSPFIPKFTVTASINNRGDVVFAANLQGPGVDPLINQSGYWAGGVGKPLRLLARTGDQAPGMPDGFRFTDGFTFDEGRNRSFVALNDAGQIMFPGEVSEDGSSPTAQRAQGIWVGTVDTGLTQLIVKTGDTTAPGPAGGQVFNELLLGNPTATGTRAEPFPLPLNNNGAFVFQAVLDGPDVSPTSDGLSLWRAQMDGSIELIAGGGNTIPGTDEYIYRGHAERSMFLRMNDAGQFVFSSSTTVDQVERPAASESSQIIRGVWAGSGFDDLSRLFYNDGAPAPGLAGATQSFSLDSAIDQNGQIAFTGQVRQSNGTFTDVIYSGTTAGGIAPILAEGDFALDPGPVGIIRSAYLPTIRTDGAVLALTQISTLEGLKNALYLIDTDDSQQILAASGDHLVDAVPDAMMSFIDQPTLNQTGWGVTLAGFDLDPDRNDDNFDALLAISPDGEISTITYEGDTFEVAPGDLRTVAEIKNVPRSNGQDGLPNALNDHNQFVFGVSFTDGSNGVFVTTIPEPSVLALLAAMLFTVASPRPNRRQA